MDNNALSSLAGLERIIIGLAQGLQKYAQKECANEMYVRKQNELILDLTKLYNQLSGLKYLELWVDIEDRIERLEKFDPELNAHTIVIHTKPSNRNNYSFIEINPFTS